MKPVLYRVLWCCLLAMGLQATRAEAVVVPQKDSALAEKSFRQPELTVPEVNQQLSEIPALAAGLQNDLTALGVNADQGFYDSRSGRWSSLILTTPLVPGTGYGNNLSWVDLGASKPLGDAAMQAQVWTALTGWLQLHRAQLRVDLAELAAPRMTISDGGALIQVHASRVVNGVPVRDSGLTAIINHGNLVLLGLQNWADVDALAVAAITADDARARAAAHASPFQVAVWPRGQQLEFVPTLRDGRYEFKLVWATPLRVNGDLGNWEALVDAGSGDLLAFEDKNLYATRRIVGGVFPVSNDGRGPEGTEQAGQPLPYANVTIGPNTVFSTTGGTLGCSTGSGTSSLAGRFVRISDTCGAVAETAAGDFDLGVSTGTDCTIPAGHSAGDTHSSRSGFYELNRLIEQSKGYLPNNAWTQQQLTSNMNINQTCNAFWGGGTVNFYRDSGSQCRNTGEIAAIFDHEWGHGLDNNGANPSISSPGESIADIRSTMRLNNSCVGRGFFKNQVCTGYGDPCTGTPTTGCTGVRDADFANHVSGQPHGITWIRANCGGGGGPCGGEVHCEGQTVSEIAWDLKARDLPAAPSNLDPQTALEITTRISYLGSETVTNWYTCAAGCETAGTCGCGATGGYLLWLAADDDNGNLNDGTPHMQAIRNAFNRHQMACNTPAVVNAGCSGGPTAAPTVTATQVDGGVNLSWTSVPNAARYGVFRAEGALGCNFGKVKIGETTGTTFSDQGLLNGRPYSYMVLPIGSNAACFGTASTCATATPTAGPNLSIRPNVTVTIAGGDGDEFLDNCERATINFTVDNIGAGNLTNVRLVAVTPVTHPSTVINTTLPAPIAASLADCAAGNGSVDVTPQGMTFNQSTQLLLAVTADQIAPATRTQLVTVTNVESDWTNTATRTFNFDTDFDSWGIQSGTWTRVAGGASGTPFHVSSSENLPDQCDAIRSPVIRLKANSTLSMFDRYNIEPTDPSLGSYDRANVGVVDLLTGARTVVIPSSGQLYTLPNAPTPQYQVCQLGDQAGWNAMSPGFPTFNSSAWSAAALNPGGTFTDKRAQLEVRYGTDPALNPDGIDFDQVVLTNFDTQTADAQNNTCAAQAAEAAGITVDASGNGVFQPNEAPVTIAPRWHNIGTQAITLTGAATNFTGPTGPTYTIADGSASYGTIAVGGTQACTDCYSLGITSATRPTQHWDSTFLETVNPSASTKTWTLHVGDSFTDVLASNAFYRFIETIFHKGVTGGCAVGQYCPQSSTTREQMAAFVLVSKEGAGYNPPACAPPNLFNDVPETSAFCKFIEELATRGVVSGCNTNPPLYCPQSPVTREQMAIFVLRTLDPALNPPACGTPVFNDVPASSPFCRWIEELARRGVVTGCTQNPPNYCPTSSVTREQMGVFLSLTFGLTLYGL